MDTVEKNLPVDAFENLFYLADGADISKLIFEIEEGKVKSELLEDQVQSINNKRSFIEVEDELLEELINGELKKWQIFLHPSQRKLVDSSFKGSIKVTGGGGTGKTVAALHRLKFLTTEKTILASQPVLFATYTTALTANLGKLIQGMNIPESVYHLANIDTLARELASKAGIISKESRFLDFPNTKSSLELWDEVLELTLCQFDAAFLHSEYQEVILYHAILSPEKYFNQSRIGRGKAITRKQRMEVWSAVEAYLLKKQEEHFLDRAEVFNKLSLYYSMQEIKPFSNVIVDEVQDFSNIELRFIRALVEEKNDDLFMVGDPYQRIYQRKINFSAAGINVRGTRSKRLRINYRTTEEIKRLAISIVKGYSYDNFEGES
ncbi:MAG: AAA family ATPase [Bacteroidales bacterium]|nr:AAA family ATPase [Bacteroidales bacterium]